MGGMREAACQPFCVGRRCVTYREERWGHRTVPPRRQRRWWLPQLRTPTGVQHTPHPAEPTSTHQPAHTHLGPAERNARPICLSGRT
jgi:hypothetical protein